MLADLKLAPEYDGLLWLAEARRNPPFLRSHRHAELELNLIVHGQLTILVEGQRYRLGKRTLLWLFPAQEHQLIDRSADAQLFVAVFKPELIRRSCRGPAYQTLRQDAPSDHSLLHSVLPVESFDLLCRLMRSLTDDGIDPDVLNREVGFGLHPEFTFQHPDPDVLNAGLHHVLLAAWRHHNRGKEPAASVSLHPAVRQALTILDSSEDKTDLLSLARHCAVTPAYLSRLFHRDVGVPINQYRNAQRLIRFWEHHRRTGNMLDAVFAAGFGSYAQFFKSFTSTYGKGPRAYLRNSPG